MYMSKHCGLSKPKDMANSGVSQVREKVTAGLGAEGRVKEESVLQEETAHAEVQGTSGEEVPRKMYGGGQGHRKLLQH